MANSHHLGILRQGVPVWNQWRSENPELIPDLSDLRIHDILPLSRLGSDLSGVNFRDCNLDRADFYNTWLVEADFTGATAGDAIFGGTMAGGAKFVNAKLERAHFQEAVLCRADFTGATLNGANFIAARLDEAGLAQHLSLAGTTFRYACLRKSDLSGSNLSGTDLQGATLIGTDLRGATLAGADLRYAQLVETEIADADFENALVYGVAVWNVSGTPRTQKNLIISPEEQASITVDDLEVAQFIYLLLRREKIRNAIETITSRAVLILGRFDPARKIVLDALVEEVRKRGLLPIMFDFEKATTRDFTETIRVLAGMSLFVIADITNPRSAPLELQAVVPDYQIPFVPIIKEGEEPFSMFKDLWVKYNKWVLDPVDYPSVAEIPLIFEKAIMERALKKHLELRKEKSKQLKVSSWKNFLEPH